MISDRVGDLPIPCSCLTPGGGVLEDHGELVLLIQRADELRGDDRIVLHFVQVTPSEIWLRPR